MYTFTIYMTFKNRKHYKENNIFLKNIVIFFFRLAKLFA